VRVYVIGVGAAIAGAFGAAAAQSTALAPSPPMPSLSLACEGGTFSRVRLKNIKERTYRDSSSVCTLSAKAEGVIWVAKGEGLALPDAQAKKLSFTDDRGRPFSQTCWTQSGGINGVTFTELILVGPGDSKGIKACCGGSCTDVQME
jgi:hypothetical protein